MAERRYPVRGEVDLAAASNLQANLLVLVNTTSDDLVVDCDGLEFIDSSGIAVFVHTQRLLELQNRGFRVVNLGALPRRAFDLLGLGEVLGVAEPEPA